MNLTPDLSNGDDWLLEETLEETVVKDELGKYAPIVLTSQSFSVSAFLIRSTTTTPEKTESWHYAGQVTMQLPMTILGLGSVSSSIPSFFESLELGLTLVIFPKVATSVYLKFYAPKWFTHVKYEIFQYVGSGYVTIEDKLQAIADLISP